MNDLQPIKNILTCPSCRGDLNFSAFEIECLCCERRYPFYDTIAQFAVFQNDWSGRSLPVENSADDYEQRYVDITKARNYNLKYERKLLKRLSTAREHQILKHLLAKQRHCKTMLEIPCGGGRISSRLADATDLLIEADIGLGQVMYGKSRKNSKTPQVWMTASALHMPFRDESLDAVICVRLSHHLKTQQQREDLLSELLRVARRYVVMTFFDYHSIKNYLRRLRKARPKLTMTRYRVSAVAAAHGGRLVVSPRLSIIGSGHRFALMVKAPPGD